MYTIAISRRLIGCSIINSKNYNNAELLLGELYISMYARVFTGKFFRSYNNLTVHQMFVLAQFYSLANYKVETIN